MIKTLSSGKIQNIALAYMIIWALSPPLSYSTLFRLAFVGCFIIWDLCAIARRSKQFLLDQLWLFAFLGIIVGISYLADGTSGITYNIQLCMFFLFLPVFQFYVTTKEGKWIIVLVLILTCIWNVTTLYGYTSVHNASRLLAKEFDGASTYAKRGIGGYGYVYNLILMIPIMEGLLIRCRRSWSRSMNILCFVGFVLSVMVVMKAGYSIAMILTIFSISIVFFIRNIKNPVGIGIGILLVFIFLFINMENILNYLLRYASGTMYELKIRDMISSLGDGEATGTVALRTERYLRSISLFLESPFWGQLSRTHIGKHSAILDRFAQYGFIIGSWFLMLLLKAQRLAYRLHVDDGVAFAMMIVSIGFCMCNNIAYAQGVGLFAFYVAAINEIENCTKFYGEEHINL